MFLVIELVPVVITVGPFEVTVIEERVVWIAV